MHQYDQFLEVRPRGPLCEPCYLIINGEKPPSRPSPWDQTPCSNCNDAVGNVVDIAPSDSDEGSDGKAVEFDDDGMVHVSPPTPQLRPNDDPLDNEDDFDHLDDLDLSDLDLPPVIVVTDTDKDEDKNEDGGKDEDEGKKPAPRAPDVVTPGLQLARGLNSLRVPFAKR